MISAGLIHFFSLRYTSFLGFGMGHNNRAQRKCAYEEATEERNVLSTSTSYLYIHLDGNFLSFDSRLPPAPRPALRPAPARHHS